MCIRDRLYAVYAADVVVTAFAASGLAKTLDAREQLADSIHAVSDAMNQAEAAMRQDKQAYYARNGQERQLRGLNEKLEQTLTCLLYTSRQMQ